MSDLCPECEPSVAAAMEVVADVAYRAGTTGMGQEEMIQHVNAAVAVVMKRAGTLDPWECQE